MLWPDVYDVRNEFGDALRAKSFVRDKSGAKMLEITGASFATLEDHIFGEPNQDYIARELAWYESQSLNVNDIPGGPPKVWQQVATQDGRINSNYGWMVWSPENNSQYVNCYTELLNNPESRRAVMIYTRPTMWDDYDKDGMSDFCCTNVVQYLYRSNLLEAVVQMRSNDVVFGYRNDYAWQKYLLDKLAKHLDVEPGVITWQVGSLHVYERDFYLVDHFCETGETSITKEVYRKVYPNSDYKP